MKYFLHDTNSFSDEKVTELFIVHGYEGIGLFFTVLEKLALQEKPIKTAVLKKQLNVGKKLEKVWSFLETIGLISSNNGETFNINLLKYSEKYQIKKEKTKERVQQFRERQQVTENVTRYDDVTERVRNADKVNKSKVNKSKVNVFNKEPAASDADASFSENDVFTDDFKGKKQNKPTPAPSHQNDKEKDKKPVTLTTLLRKVVDEYSVTYVWDAKHMTAMKQVGEKMRVAVKRQRESKGQISEVTDDDVVSAFTVMLNRMDELPNFYRFKTVPDLNRDFNAILEQLRKPQTDTKRRAAIKQQEAAEFANEIDQLIELKRAYGGFD